MNIFSRFASEVLARYAAGKADMSRGMKLKCVVYVGGVHHVSSAYDMAWFVVANNGA